MNHIFILSLLKSYIIHNYTLFRKVFSIPYATIILFFIFATLSRYFPEKSVIVYYVRFLKFPTPPPHYRGKMEK